jgi:hypothetical protein
MSPITAIGKHQRLQWVARRGGAMHVNANTRVVVCAPTAERRE